MLVHNSFDNISIVWTDICYFSDGSDVHTFCADFTVPEYGLVGLWWHTHRKLAESYCDTDVQKGV
jgi:hypothetical protein